MNFDETRKWISTVSLVMIAVAAVVTSIHVAEIRRQTIALRHAAYCDDHVKIGRVENWPPLCRSQTAPASIF